MVDVELLGRQVVEDGGALAHELIEFLADGQFGVVARLQVVEPGAGFQQFAQHVGDEGNRRHGVDRRQVRRLRQTAQMALREEERQRQQRHHHQQHEVPGQIVVGLVEMFTQRVAWAAQQRDADGRAAVLPRLRLPADQDEDGRGRPCEAGGEDAQDDGNLVGDLSHGYVFPALAFRRSGALPAPWWWTI